MQNKRIFEHLYSVEVVEPRLAFYVHIASTVPLEVDDLDATVLGMGEALFDRHAPCPGLDDLFPNTSSEYMQTDNTEAPKDYYWRYLQNKVRH